MAGVWRAPLRLKVKIVGSGPRRRGAGHRRAVGAGRQGQRQSEGSQRRSRRRCSISSRRTRWRRISACPRASRLPADRLTFDDLDSTIAGSRLRGRLAVTLDGERNVEGEVGLDTLDLAPAFALAIGAAGHDAAEPLGSGLLKGWRGHVAFQALRGALPGGSELRPVSGTVKGDGQSLTFDAIKGGIGGGEATANIDARQGREWHCVECARSARRRRWRGVALSRRWRCRRAAPRCR